MTDVRPIGSRERFKPTVRAAATAGVLAALGLLGFTPAAGAETVPPGAYTSVSVGDGFTCAVRTDTSLVCWGNNRGDRAEPPAGSFKAVGAGFGHACALRTDGTIACWGEDRTGETVPPNGAFTHISVGEDAACALKPDRTFLCWGEPLPGLPLGEFSAVSIGSFSGCAIRMNATLACWGVNNNGQATPPAGTFTQVQSGSGFACAVRTDATLACWGDNRYGRATPPAGTFTSVSADIGGQACALRTNARLACWGYNASGLWTPPKGTFTQVDVGNAHSCAVRTDAAVVCWGSGYQLPAISPAAAFKLPSAKRCVNRRHPLVVRVRAVTSVSFSHAVVELRAKRVRRVKRLTSAEIPAAVKFRKLPRGRFTIAITATASDGRTVAARRRYTTCGGSARSRR